jgi:acetolactate synthase-1/2/3 large subunit
VAVRGSETMTGAESVLRTLAASGVRACFANPGTSEMHLVAALDRVPEVRPVLALFEGVASGAADGYARMAGEPAATLFHLGPGLGNGFANVHNAFKARTPMVNLVGDHAVMHAPLGAPLTSDVEGIARPVSDWVRTTRDARSAATDTALAVAAARSRGGGVATLVLPADAGWSPGTGAAAPVAPTPRAPVPPGTVEDAERALRSTGAAALLVGGQALRGPGMRAAARIAAATGATLFRETFPPRLERGAGRPTARPLQYLIDLALESLAPFQQLIVAGTRPPVGFFAYPGQPGRLWPEDAEVQVLAGPEEDAVAALEALADALGASADGPVAGLAPPEPPSGPLTPAAIAAAVGATLPEEAVIVDESVTLSVLIVEATAGAPPHDLLALTGGAIGWGLPAATGAAIAAPGRPVLSLEGDGSAMYTLQALWTQAREGLDVTTVIMANRSYAILDFELARTGAPTDGAATRELFGLGRPDLGFAELAQGMGVPGRRVEHAEALVAALREAYAEPGPHLIEAVF